MAKRPLISADNHVFEPVTLWQERLPREYRDRGPRLERRDDWLVMSIPVRVEVREAHPDPSPSAEWFDHLQAVRPDTEREVEMHFASPLFQGLGYREDQIHTLIDERIVAAD